VHNKQHKKPSCSFLNRARTARFSFIFPYEYYHIVGIRYYAVISSSSYIVVQVIKLGSTLEHTAS